jgi:hypothetical protein
MIGRLETPHVWDEHVVCAECHAALSGKARQAATTEAGAGDAVAVIEPAGRREGGRFCSACGRGVPMTGVQYIKGDPYCAECFVSYSRPATPAPVPQPVAVAVGNELDTAAALALAR